MKYDITNKTKWQKHYLASLHGRTYSEEAGRTFPVLPNPELYERFAAEHKNANERDISEDDPTRILIASDHHFYHRNIIKYADRPYSMDDVVAMNEDMIARHNLVVRPQDVVFFLGDIAFCDDDRANEILERMNGYKILIVGNHDWNKKKKLKGYKVDEVHVSYHIDLPEFEFDLLLTHAPFSSPEMANERLVNIHGHIHANMMSHPRFVNVCVEHICYTPRHLCQLVLDTFSNRLSGTK